MSTLILGSKKTEIPVIVSSLSDTKDVAFLGSEMNDENIYIRDWWVKGEEYCKKCVLHKIMNPLDDGTNMFGEYVINIYNSFGFVNVDDSTKELIFNPMTKNVCRIFIRINGVDKQAITYTKGFFTLATLTLPYEVSDKDIPSMSLYQELQTKISELQTENAALKETIATIEQRLSALEKANDPDSEWKEYYVGFTENVTEELASYFAFDYDAENKRILNIYSTTEDGKHAPAGDYLLIFYDKDMKKHFIRGISIEIDSDYIYDEFYLHENAPKHIIYDDVHIDINIDSVENKSFDEIYRKV